MTRSEFLSLLEDPHALARLPLEELQGLALRYPYAANIRLLLLLRTHGEEATAATGDYLAPAAAATFDRAHLYDLLQQLERNPAPAGDTLELIELDELAAERLAAPPQEQLPSRMNEAASVVPQPVSAPAPPPPPAAPPPPGLRLGGWASRAAAWSEVGQAAARSFPPPAPGRPRPEDPTKFTAPAAPPDPLHRRAHLERLRRRSQPRRPAPAPDRDLGHIAAASLGDRGAIASETLAELLVQQQQYRSAIRMYRRLMLLNPEKGPIFAGLIEALKEKLSSHG